MKAFCFALPLLLLIACGDDDGPTSCDPAECTGSCIDGRCVPLIDGGLDSAPADTGVDAIGADTGADEGMCESLIFCGTPPECCALGTECVNDACLPSCASGVRCGATCCDNADDVCVDDACVAPGDACTDNFDCPADSFCEPTLERCLAQFDPITCETEPVFGDFNVEPELELTGSTDRPECFEAISAPVVVDLDGDAIPEIVANFGCSGSGLSRGAVRAFRGDTGEELWVSETVSYGRISIAAGDLKNDGNVVIVGLTERATGGRRAFALDASGNELWQSVDGDGMPLAIAGDNGAPTLADLDGDGVSEILWGAVALDADGRLLWSSGQGGNEGSETGYTGGISAVADIDGDGLVDIVSGHSAWERDGTMKWTAPGIPDGYPALAQFDDDPQAEIALVALGTVYVLDGVSGEVQWSTPIPTTDPSRNRGGPPTVADFDGDGLPEIGVAGGTSYAVLDPNEMEPVLWTANTIDTSSNSTGSSVFDFQGDGTAEVVYQDECNVWVFSGADGTVLLSIPSTSATIHEYPLVVDVDADGNSELVTVANAFANGSTCPGGADYEGVREGIFVYGDLRDQWVRTRRVWNQHAYGVTNVNADGSIPSAPRINWETEGLNNFRQNVQGEGVFNAPDLQVGLSFRLDRCSSQEVTLLARVTNEGNLGVAAGVEVVFYEGTVDARGAELGRAATRMDLLPGGAETVALIVPLPAGGAPGAYSVSVDGSDAGGVVEECREDNNDADADDVRCVLI